MRRLIYAGESGGEAIYFDTKTNQIYKRKKSYLLNTKPSGKIKINRILFIGIFFLLLFFGGSIGKYAIWEKGTYNWGTLVFIGSFWMLEIIGLSRLVDNALYKPIRKTKIDELELANRKEFRYAIINNNIWNNFSNKKVTVGKKIWAWGMTCFLMLMGIIAIALPFMFNSRGLLLGYRIGPEIFVLIALGILPFSSILFIWINNPIRWFNMVEKYQKRKL